jgi:hypothetical protein
MIKAHNHPARAKWRWPKKQKSRRIKRDNIQGIWPNSWKVWATQWKPIKVKTNEVTHPPQKATRGLGFCHQKYQRGTRPKSAAQGGKGI